MSDRLASVPLVDVDSFESLNVGTWAGVPRTWHSRFIAIYAFRLVVVRFVLAG